MPGPIALKLRVLREERGLTPKEAAELTNVSHWTLIAEVAPISHFAGATLRANFVLTEV